MKTVWNLWINKRSTLVKSDVHCFEIFLVIYELHLLKCHVLPKVEK